MRLLLGTTEEDAIDELKQEYTDINDWRDVALVYVILMCIILIPTNSLTTMRML